MKQCGNGWSVELVLTTSYSVVLLFSPVVPNLGVRAPSKGQKINLKGHKMMNGQENKEKQSSATEISINVSDCF